MPKSQKPKLIIHLDLLKPQSNPERLAVKLIRWLLSTGRFIFVFVEAVVLMAFIARFKLDADLQSNKEAIEQQLPYIESLRPFEILIRQTQFKLETYDSFYKTYVDYAQILTKIADQTPLGVKLVSLNLERKIDTVTINLSGQAQGNSDLAIFLNGLKADQTFSAVAIASIGFEKGSLNFSLSAQAKPAGPGGKI